MQLEDEIFFHQRTLSLKVLHWSWHILLGVSYLLWSYQLPITVAAPLSAILMVAHGSWLMFISLRPQQGQTIKLAAIFFALAAIKVIFIDMAAFELIQKHRVNNNLKCDKVIPARLLCHYFNLGLHL